MIEKPNFLSGDKGIRLALCIFGWVAMGVSVHSADVSFKRTVVDKEPPSSPWIKMAGDLNKDGKPELLIGGAHGPLVWYENSSWKKAVIATGGYDSVDGETADIDNDGDLDVIVGGVLWHENPLPDSDLAEDAWNAHRIDRFPTHDIEVGDLDGDGRVDVVARDQSRFGGRTGNRVVLYKQISPTEWRRRDLVCPHGEGLKVADLDRDGDGDVVIGARWYENPGSILEGDWTEHIYTEQWDHEDCSVEAADLNNDGRLDIVLSPSEPKGEIYRVAWYEAPVYPKQPGWKERMIEPDIETVIHALASGDLNQDGLVDLVTAKMHQGSSPQEVTVYLNANQGEKWSRQVISEKGSHNIKLLDANGDGRWDVAGANHGGPYQPVELWINEGSGNGSPAVRLIEESADPSVPGLECYKIVTPTAIYYLEKSGAGLSSIIDTEGNNWISFDPREGSGAGGEYRGFPNAVFREEGNYFHPKNSATDPSITKIESVKPDHVIISAMSQPGHWRCRYDFYPDRCTFTLTSMPSGHRYWVLYEGTPGGGYDERDWWMTSAMETPRSLTEKHEGDVAAPEWIVFGDAKLERVLFLFHHEDDAHPDDFYQMQEKMTVFGFGRRGLTKYLDSVPQSVSIGLFESSDHGRIRQFLDELAR